MNNKIICDGCGYYVDEFFLNKHKCGKHYCFSCKTKTHECQTEESKFDAMLKSALQTPPLKLKDLKARLKKEREERKNSKDKKNVK